MKIRHAEQEDAEGIQNVALKSWKDTYKELISREAIEEIINEWYSISSLKEQTSHPVFYVAEENNSIIGFVHASIEEDRASLHRIYLDPEHQGKGIGSKMYEKAENELKTKAEEIKLEVLAENKKGNAFYDKKGFETEKTEQIELKGEKVRQKIMKKELND